MTALWHFLDSLKFDHLFSEGNCRITKEWKYQKVSCRQLSVERTQVAVSNILISKR